MLTSTGLSSATYDPLSDWTHISVPPAHGPRLHRQSSCSFVATDIEHLSDWLQQQGWSPLPSRSASEYTRLVRGRQLVVLYFTGSVLCQGAHLDRTLELLGQLESEAVR